MRDTVCGAIEAGVLSELEHFKQWEWERNKGHDLYKYSAKLKKYRETHERVLLIFKRRSLSRRKFVMCSKKKAVVGKRKADISNGTCEKMKGGRGTA